MLKLTKPQLLAVLAALVLVVLIVLLPRKANHPLVTKEGVSEKIFSFEKIYNDAFTQLSENNKRVIDHLKESIAREKNDSLRSLLNDSLANVWKAFNWPTIVAYYFEQSASIRNNEKSWFKAGDAYFAAFRFVNENKEYTLDKAIYCYQKILEMDSANLSAKTSIGVCFIEGASYLGKAPMEGVLMLQQVLDKDPKNINALFNLGYFAIQSAQYEKALERFKTILQIDSTYAEAYIYMSDAYLSLADTSATIRALKNYRAFVSDETIKEQIENYITELTEHKH